jgi:hypothetical protein
VQKDNFCFCKSDVMSMCKAGSEGEQRRCKFYKKSSHSDKCMYLVFDEFCECLEAQLATRKSGRSDNDDLVIIICTPAGVIPQSRQCTCAHG